LTVVDVDVVVEVEDENSWRLLSEAWTSTSVT
jgi:hypothetical protein